jgi:hypothetical protein
MRKREAWIAGSTLLFLFVLRHPIGLVLSKHHAAPLPNPYGDPIQTPAGREPFVFVAGGKRYRITPRFAWDESAFAVGEKAHRFDAAAGLVPVDYALAWGIVLKPPYAGKIHYLQTGRFYLWSTRAPGLDHATVASHTANTHVIPASARLRRVCAAVSAGDLVRLEGWLVDADGVDDPSFHWRTSTSREDEGPGACETVFLTRLTINRRVYD